MSTPQSGLEPKITISFDAYPPAQMAERVEGVGVTKVQLQFWNSLMLAILAGAFIALGAEFSTLTITGISPGFGLQKLAGGVTFCLGLILVVVAGAELFTGNNLIVMAWASGNIGLGKLLGSWALVYVGNLIGSLATVGLMFLTEQWKFANFGVGATALTIANAKVNLAFMPALARGIMCNALVCLAVWLCFSARSVTDKILAILFPITAFVASGFEHSIANMYFIPMGIALSTQPDVVAAAGLTAADLVRLNWGGFVGNLVPVTIGNIIGGGVMVAFVYWFIYLRERAWAARREAAELQEAASGGAGSQ
jgi:formate transporter